MPHKPGRGIHSLVHGLRINHSHSDDSPQESLVGIGWLLPPESLQLFMVEEGLHPKVVVHSKSLELLSQGKVCENHIMDLNCNKLVFNQTEDRFVSGPLYPKLSTCFEGARLTQLVQLVTASGLFLGHKGQVDL